MNTIEFFFDFGSPTTYLAHTQLPRIAAETGAQLVYRPMLLGGVFKATGNASPVTVPAKGRWMGQDIARWAARYGVPFAFNPHFPINTLTLMRGAAGVQELRLLGQRVVARGLDVAEQPLEAEGAEEADAARRFHCLLIRTNRFLQQIMIAGCGLNREKRRYAHARQQHEHDGHAQ